MSTPENELASALRDRLRIIADRAWVERDAPGHLVALQEISEKIASLGRSLPRPVDPQLTHFLERCSYDKALAFLESGMARH